MQTLWKTDPEVARCIEEEINRQDRELILIASENYASPEVLAAMGTPLTNKYAEGYPGRRYYRGCEWADRVESLAVERALALFGADHANVQPHSGTQANLAVLMAALKPGETILSMDLAHGGHLSHGMKINFSGGFYDVVSYGVEPESGLIDYGRVRDLALRHRPRLIICGASAYPRVLDFRRFRQIADEAGAVLLADVAHIAGLVAAKLHPDPVPEAEFVTMTTHKTLRGPRGGMVLCREAYARKLDSRVFPGMQGGPLMHVIAAKAVAFGEALRPGFAEYQQAVVKNARALGETLRARGFPLVSGGTDTHLLLVDLRERGMTGAEADVLLEETGIVCNRNLIPFDPLPPTKTSGIRLGTPAATTRGLGEAEFRRVGEWIADVLEAPGDAAVRERVRKEVRELTSAFPLYPSLRAAWARPG
ncbi:MAG TPA: serine hydroxymethyltransferase [bacterium]|nr:serine hydroxymethyltransferase [bacterium]HPJ71675.1 serine hydroxymethyltransferase [bacterium]HPQ66474.1 serine hydroxymethyltransferase [bacterium]